jgi:glycerol-3-phosphate acyltransferase PlsY
VLWLVGAYLIGAVPVGFLVARALGIDIRSRGSGNIGATNVLRTAGRGPAIATLVGDVVKGYAGAWMGSLAGPGPWWAAMAAVAVVVGNCWPVFLGFRGGKGVATGLGAFLRVAPWAIVPAAVVWITVVATFRFVSLGSVCAVLGLPVAVLVLGYGLPATVSTAIVALIVVARHRENVSRLLAGTERRLGQGEPPGAPTLGGGPAERPP